MLLSTEDDNDDYTMKCVKAFDDERGRDTGVAKCWQARKVCD